VQPNSLISGKREAWNPANLEKKRRPINGNPDRPLSGFLARVYLEFPRMQDRLELGHESHL